MPASAVRSPKHEGKLAIKLIISREGIWLDQSSVLPQKHAALCRTQESHVHVSHLLHERTHPRAQLINVSGFEPSLKSASNGPARINPVRKLEEKASNPEPSSLGRGCRTVVGEDRADLVSGHRNASGAQGRRGLWVEGVGFRA